MRYKLNIKKIYKKTSKLQLIILALVILLLTIAGPTLARYKNRVTHMEISAWDGSVATSYASGTGTQNDPYIISNGSQLAYLQTQLPTENYLDKYFKLSHDIILNKGKFEYNETDGIMYILNQTTYYIKEYTNKYYDNPERTGTEIGTVNDIAPLDGFQGHFSGDSLRILGLYMKSNNAEELALFTDLRGNISELHVENSVVYGGNITAGIASKTTNVEVTNVIYEGYVIGKNTGLTDIAEITPTISNVNVLLTQSTKYFDLTNEIPFAGSLINGTSLAGNYIINGATDQETTIKINGQTISGGSFNINLGTTILNEVELITSTTVTGTVTLSFSNLTYNVDYDYGVAGGIIAISEGTTLENVVNKSFVKGYSTAGGLLGVTTKEATINKSYNTGLINSSNIAGGLIGAIEKSNNPITINKSYNSADIFATDFGGIIGYIKNNTGSVSINNVFNTSLTDYSIGIVSNSTVSVNDVYYVNGSKGIKTGTVSGSFLTTTMSNLHSKTYIETNLGFSIFQDFTDVLLNDQNVWVFDKDSLPILFIDDLNSPIATISASVYNWDNLSYDLNNIYLKSSTAFVIEEQDILRPFKEVYYYISNSNVVLTEAQIAQISWTSYTSMVQITTEGSYIIYAKVVDNSDEVYYLNSDIIVIDLTDPTGSITYNEINWNTFTTTLDKVYADKTFTISASASDYSSGLKSFEYYLSSTALTTTNLNELDKSVWVNYENEIEISQKGTTIMYLRIIDKSGNKIYINSGYIIYDGYNQNDFYVGKNIGTYPAADLYITNKSAFSFTTTYEKTTAELLNHTHNLTTNILLPLNTTIYLKDNKNEKIYTYQIPTASDIYNYNNSCNEQGSECIKFASYPFTLFKEVGTTNPSKFYIEDSYYQNGTISEDFTITIDFAKTNISTNYTDVYAFLELHNSTGKNVRPTLEDTKKKINIYSTVNALSSKAKLTTETTYLGGAIDYNSDSNISVPLTSSLLYKKDGGKTITDTTYEDKEIGLVIRMEDASNNIIEAKYLDNVMFKIGNKIYYPGDDNLVRIDFKNGLANAQETLSITTFKNNNLLKDGKYYFKISSYTAYDGLYYDERSTDEITIQINVSKPYAGDDYSFSVNSQTDYRIINKKETNVQIIFDVLQTGTFENPNIRVSLYKKDQLTAYNQDYSLVNLANYVANNLINYGGFVYYVSSNPQENTTFNLNLITNNFSNTGYKFLFELYDGNKLVGPLEKYFIVR